jgi:transcriptional regulator with XRE-family HTH domain
MNNMINKELQRQRIGQRIAEIRKAQGITQQDLADRTGIQRNHISRIEQGRYSVGFDTLQLIAEAMGGNVEIITP